MRFLPIETAALLLLLAGGGAPAGAEGPSGLERLSEGLSFHCSWDAGPEADFARGDRRVASFLRGDPLEVKFGLWLEHVTIEETGGRYGGAMRFTKSKPQFLMYAVADNLAYDAKDWNNTVSFWMSLEPDEDLEPGFPADPLHITDASKWNDASIWLTFGMDPPWNVIVGALPDIDLWNPEGKKWSELEKSKQPQLVVESQPFRGDEWTHVVITFLGFKRAGKDGVVRLYYDRELQGEMSGHRQIYTWDLATAAIRLGYHYAGRFDDLALFDYALDTGEVKALHALPDGVAGLHLTRTDLGQENER